MVGCCVPISWAQARPYVPSRALQIARCCQRSWSLRLLYTGSEGPQQKENAKDKFVRGDTNLLICSLQSGRGLDGIQNRCRVGVFGELDWSPAVHQQAVGRYHRDGQKDNCLTYYLVSEDGSDPLMLESIGMKKVQVDGVIQSKDKSSVLAEREAADHLKQLAKQFLQAS